MADFSEKLCYFCNPGEEKSKFYLTRDTGPLSLECLCEYCGHYYIVEDAFEVMNKRDNSLFQKLRAVAAMRKLQGRDGYTLSLSNDYSTIMIGENRFLDEYPSDFFEKLQKILWNIGRLTNFDPTKSIDFDDTNFQYLFCDNNWDALQLIDFLFKEHYITDNAADKAFYSQNVFSAADVHLTMAGLAEISKVDNNEQCFVAMWFDDYMKPYRKAIKQAINQAGYQPRIADEELHNEQIMPQVLNLIKNSRFVIADLTSFNTDIRGGVYYEAGYAKGLGLPVILTCEEKCMSQVHFDLKQVMCYMWSDNNGVLKFKDQDFVDVITQNILLNVGPGPRRNNNLK